MPPAEAVQFLSVGAGSHHRRIAYLKGDAGGDAPG